MNMAGISTWLRVVFSRATAHRALASPHPGNDPHLDAVFNPYNPRQFRETKITASGVRATFYGDETDGTKFHGYPSASGIQYNAHAFTAALNPGLLKKFPAGSYVRVETPSGAKTDVLITDSKGGEGIDLSRAAAKKLGVTNPVAVKLTLIKPANCKDSFTTASRHPMASCYPRDIRLKWNERSPVFSGRNYQRNGPFDFHMWEIAALTTLAGANTGIARPYAYTQLLSGNGKKREYVAAAGPFPDVESALLYAEKYCGVCDSSETACSSAERKTLKQECGVMTVYDAPWKPTAGSPIYRSRKNETNVQEMLAKKRPQKDDKLVISRKILK